MSLPSRLTSDVSLSFRNAHSGLRRVAVRRLTCSVVRKSIYQNRDHFLPREPFAIWLRFTPHPLLVCPREVWGHACDLGAPGSHSRGLAGPSDILVTILVEVDGKAPLSLQPVSVGQGSLKDPSKSIPS